MLADTYKDQIMTHPSRDWTRRFIQKLKQSLGDKWDIVDVDKNTANIHLTSSQKKDIRVQLMHIPIGDIREDDILITDIVHAQPHNRLIELYPYIYHEFQIDFDYQHVMPNLLYNCLIHRGCPFRQSWIYQLIRRQLIDHGFVSYWCEDRFSNRPPQEYFELLFLQNQTFFDEHEELQGKIPFKNFELPIEQAIMSSQKTLIIETFFDNNDYVCYSEKTWRNIQLPRPWLLFNSQNAVSYLRDWGFDVFDDYVDHGYDIEPDPIQRQNMILDQLSNNIYYTPALVDDLERRALHNRNLMKNFALQWPDRYKKILSKIEKLC
jgi:hypothetical protein